MTLQLEVGKTYRARNGDVVKIVDFCEGVDSPYICDDGQSYAADGVYIFSSAGNDEWDLVAEATDPFARVLCAVNDAERAEAEAMERMRESLAELRAAVEAAQKAMRGEG